MDSNYFVEYKDTYSDSVVKTICAFLNSHSGRIVIHFTKLDADDSWIVLRGRIREDLEDSIWAFSIDENGKLIDVKSENPEVVYKNVSYYFFEEDERSLKMYIDIIKPEVDNVFFCVRRKVRKSFDKTEGIDNEQSTNKEFAYDYYFRIEDRNVKPNNTYLPYLEKVKRYNFPIIRDYEPAEYSAKKEFKTVRDENKVVFQVVGELPHGNCFYKYMDLESALRCLERKKHGGKTIKNPNIRFVEPTNWDDQYEGRFYTAHYRSDEGNGVHNDINSMDAPFLYACCFSSKRENEAAWVLYSHNRSGLASRCVEFTINRMKLREELVKNLKNCALYIGAVQYMNKEKIDNIPFPSIGNDNHRNVDYDKYFKPFIRESYLNLLLLKRPAFEHEKEIRFFIVPNDCEGKQKTRKVEDGKYSPNEKPYHYDVDIDWVEVIDSVKYDVNCTEYEVSLLQSSLNKLAMEKKKKDKLKKAEYEALLAKLTLKQFNPYKDESLKQGPITIVTNQ